MARPLILSNGSLAVCMDNTASVSDLYFPYVGLSNHADALTPHHKVGVYVDDAIHWLDDGTWNIAQDYYPGRLIGRTIADNPWLDIRIEFQDFVDYELNVFARNIHLINTSNRNRNVKLYLHQAFVLNEASDGRDTAEYIPAKAVPNIHYPAIYHYKGNITFALTGDVACHGEPAVPFDSFSVGRFGGIGPSHRDGVWCDAADGRLAKNPIEHGLTDSIIQFNVNLAPHDSARVHYELAAGDSLDAALHDLRRFNAEGFDSRLGSTDEYWGTWIKPAASLAATKVDGSYRYTFIDSLLLLKAMTDNHGAIISSLDTETLRHTSRAYNGCCPRDGAVAALTYAKLGYNREALNFYSFMASTLSNEGYLNQVYRPDGSLGQLSHSWLHGGKAVLPIQTDQTATVLYSFCRSAQIALANKANVAEWKRLFNKLAIPAANFLSDYIDPTTKLPKPSYDIWGVVYETTTYTTAVTYKALSLAADLAEHFKDTGNAIKYRTTADEMRDNAYMLWNKRRNYFYRGFTRNDNNIIGYDETIDASSFYAAWYYGLFDDDLIAEAQRTLSSRFNLTDDKPRSPRYESDGYGGYENTWYITTLWFAQYQINRHNTNYGKNALDWVDQTIENRNGLAEQVNLGGDQVISASPTTWSHVEYINTCLCYGRPETSSEGKRDV